MDDIRESFYPKKTNTSNQIMMNKTQALLNNVYPPFISLLKRVLQTNRFGVTCGTIELVNVTSSHGDEKGDRFNITIPYARQSLCWTVMFDASNPEIGPDFDFNDKTFLADPDIDIMTEFVPSLMTWNSADKNCLLNVLTELVLCYKLHQRKRLGERLDLEYSSLVGQTEICEEDVEIMLLPEQLDPFEAHFLIRIATDFSKLPKKSSGTDQVGVMLHVIFQGVNWNRITPQIYFSSSLNDALGNISNLHIPPLPPNKPLMDYVPEIKQMIDDKVKAVVANHEMKKKYIQALLLIQPGSILEYDASDFSYATILLSERDFYIAVHFHLSLSFPKDNPKIILQSLYHLDGSNGEPIKCPSNNVPYSPRWDPKKMVTKALVYISEKEFELFKTRSTRYRRF